jgi:phage-related protein
MDDSTEQYGIGDDQVVFTPSTSTDYFFEIAKDGGSYTVSRYTDDTYGTVADSASGSSDASGLQYIKVASWIHSSSWTQGQTKAEIDDITGYLDSLNGVSKFSFTIPDSNAASNDETTIQVVCDTVSQAYNNGGFYSANATFRRVYEA